jgi:hypothetical protein
MEDFLHEYIMPFNPEELTFLMRYYTAEVTAPAPIHHEPEAASMMMTTKKNSKS